MYLAETRSIEIEVVPTYLADHSDPIKKQYVFAYYIRIKNNGTQTVQLISRYWLITDGTQQTKEVRGAGVVGQTPILKPNETHEYTSFCPLSTPTGNMRGSYTFSALNEQGAPIEQFEAKIPLFFFRTDLIHEPSQQTH